MEIFILLFSAEMIVLSLNLTAVTEYGVFVGIVQSDGELSCVFEGFTNF